MSGRTRTDSGLALISTSSHEKSTERRAQAMENISPQNANVIRIITDQDASTGMSARPTRIAAFKENVLMLAALHCLANNATAISDGSDQAATKVRKRANMFSVV